MLGLAFGIVAFVGGITFLLSADRGTRRLWGLVPGLAWLFLPVLALGLPQPFQNILTLAIQLGAAALGAKLLHQGRLERFLRVAAADEV